MPRTDRRRAPGARKILTFSLLALAVLGCEGVRPRRVGSQDEPRPYVDEPVADPTFTQPAESRGFFKPRGAAAWSDEAREIESSLGAVP